MLPRLRFAHLPTPIEPLSRLSQALAGPQLWVKRDDQTGLALGGNKTRKLEFLLADAQAHGARMLITGGAAQSNHCRLTAAAAARFGFKCRLVLTDAGLPTKLPRRSDSIGSAGFEPGVATKSLTGNRMLDHLLGAKIIWSQSGEREETLRDTFNTAWEAGERPYLIPYGGSNEVGATGYVIAIQELIEQCTGSSPLNSPPDWIIFPTSSGGTHAGLAAGARLFGYHGKILGICIDEAADTMRPRVAQLAASTADVNGVPLEIPTESILANDSYLGEGYGVMSDAEPEAIFLFARIEGVLLDPVYTGRAAAGMIDLIRRGFFKRDETVLFWHTGGTPALFAEQYREALSLEP